MKINTIYNKNALNPKDWDSIPDNSINCCVTSPPYWGLRDYGHENQLGLEETPEEYVSNIVTVFEEVRRVLKPDGTLWLNLGDSYAGSTMTGGNNGINSQGGADGYKHKRQFKKPNSNIVSSGLKPKDLVGIPWMVAFALRANGWYLRQDLIWHKKNPMPESVTDRCTKSHEYIFLMSKSQKYYYDAEAIKQPLTESSISRLSQDIQHQNGSDRVPGKTNGRMKAVRANGRGGYEKEKDIPLPEAKANKRSVWTVTTKPFSEAHFATFPEKLIIDCIKAGCPENGIVLDPFMGAGTTALVARKLNRNYIGFEINPEYIKIAEKRLYNELGIFV